MAGYKRYAKKAYSNIKKKAVKRYGTKSGGVRLQQVVRDVAKIQRSLNVEHKHIDYRFGSATNSGQRPTKDTPIIIALPTPVKGTGYNNRIGNQIRVVHMTSKLEFTCHMDYSNLIADAVIVSSSLDGGRKCYNNWSILCRTLSAVRCRTKSIIYVLMFYIE